MKSTVRSNLLLLATTTTAALPTGLFLAMCWVRNDSGFDAEAVPEWQVLAPIVFIATVSTYLLTYFLLRHHSYRYLAIPLLALALSTVVAIVVPQVFGKRVEKPLSYELFGSVLVVSFVLSGALNAIVFGLGKATSQLFNKRVEQLP